MNPPSKMRYSAHLDKWHVPTFGNMNDTVAVRVPGEIPAYVRMASDRGDETLRCRRNQPEITVVSRIFRRPPDVMVSKQQHRRRGVRRYGLDLIELLISQVTVGKSVAARI